MITVVTPTYNRKGKLENCFLSLKRQTNKKFIWLIIDDGSDDNTEQLVSVWMNEFSWIKYVKKENGGKASALNKALDIIDTDYVVCLDSDDMFYDQTIELALKDLNSIVDDTKCCGILALRNNKDGTVMGNKEIPKKMKKIIIANILVDMHYSTEVICFYKTDIIKKYRFPEFIGERFVSPSWIQYEITKKYYFKTSWNRLCCCEYCEDGLTRNKRKVIAKNPYGYTAVRIQSFYFAKSFKSIIRNGIMYNCGCIIGKNKNWLKDSPKKIWTILLLPAGYFVYLVRYKKLCKILQISDLEKNI